MSVGGTSSCCGWAIVVRVTIVVWLGACVLSGICVIVADSCSSIGDWRGELVESVLSQVLC